MPHGGYGDVTSEDPKQPEGTQMDEMDKSHVVDWLLKSDEDSVLWALARLASQRPSLLARVQASPGDFPSQPREASRHEACKSHSDAKATHPPIVQFGSAYTYCSEQDGVARLQVVRIGNKEPRIEVWAKTTSCSAKAGQKFLPFEGKIVFEPGRWEAEIEITLIDDDSWDPNLELSVQLQQEGLVNATLGRYLWETRVKIIDDESFPTNKYKELLTAQRSLDISPLALFVEYVKMNFKNPTVRWRTYVVVLLGQVDNFVFFLELFSSVYLVDYVFNLRAHGNPPWVIKDEWLGLFLCALCYVIPFSLVHYLHYIRASLGHVGGNSRKVLQAALVRQFLNFDYSVRGNLRSTDLVMSVSRDSFKLVSSGYKAALRLSGTVGHLAVVLLFQLTAPIFFHHDTSPIALFLVLLFPIVIVVFLVARYSLTSKRIMGRIRKENELMDYVRHTVENFELIAAYHRRPDAVDHFQVIIDDFNTDNRMANVVLLNNAFFIVWVGKAMVCAWTLIGGARVLNGDLTLGMFLANIRICVGIGKSWTNVYSILLEISCTFPLLQHLVKFMNSPTDVELRSALARHNKEVTEKFLYEEKKAFIDLPIQMSNVDFSYRSVSSNGADRITNLNKSGLLEVRQGELVCLVGPRGCGKTTVLKLLSGQILPSMEDATSLSELDRNDPKVTSEAARMRFYVPAHLRVLAVASEPMFIHGSLLDNLLYGVHPDGLDAATERVEHICSRLGLGTAVLELVRNGEVHRWNNVISQTEKHLLSLARALVSNPEVLCLHKPTLILDSQHVDYVNRMLTEFVTHAGVELSAYDQSLRVPRTCIFTTTKALVPQNADRLYNISAGDGIRLVPNDGLCRTTSRASASY